MKKLEIILKLRSYAYLEYYTDQLNNDKTKFYQKIEESVLDCEKDLIFYGIELNKLDDNKTSVFSETNIKIGLRITRSLKNSNSQKILKNY